MLIDYPYQHVEFEKLVRIPSVDPLTMWLLTAPVAPGRVVASVEAEAGGVTIHRHTTNNSRQTAGYSVTLVEKPVRWVATGMEEARPVAAGVFTAVFKPLSDPVIELIWAHSKLRVIKFVERGAGVDSPGNYMIAARGLPAIEVVK